MKISISSLRGDLGIKNKLGYYKYSNFRPSTLSCCIYVNTMDIS